MKTALIFAGLCLLAATTLHATPDHRILIEERFAGSNHTTYAVLRTETDNLCSYFDSLRKVYLDERSKDGKTTVKSTLLLDEKRMRDASHADPKTPAPVTVQIFSRDDSISMAAVQEKFPRQQLRTWYPDELKRLSIGPAGIGFDENRIMLADNEKITKEAFGGRDLEGDWKLDEIAEDSNAIYLRVTRGGESGMRETRVVFVGQEKIDQVRAQTVRKERYLLLGTYDTQEAAIAQAQQWNKDGYGYLEIWSLLDGKGFVVVDPAEYKIAPQQAESISKRLGVAAGPIQGQALGIRIRMPGDLQ